nr:hypothetical protein [Tanacetum cinerariifolium]
YPCDMMSSNEIIGICPLGFGQGHMRRSGRGICPLGFGQGHMGRSGRGVWYFSCGGEVHRLGWGEGWVVWRERFSPSGDFEIFTLLVPGLWILTFEGLGFDLLARLKNLLLDLAFLVASNLVQLLSGFLKKNVDIAYLLWENFVYQVEHKDAKKSNDMYYPRNSEAYKEYYAVASGAAPPKTKASVKKTKSSFGTSITPPTAAAMIEAEQLKLATKRSLQQTHISQASDDDDDDDQDEGHDDDQDIDEEGEEFIHPKLSIHDEEETKEESFNPIAKTPENSDDEGNDDKNLGFNVASEEGQDAEDDEDELYRDATSIWKEELYKWKMFTLLKNLKTLIMLNPTPDAGIDSLFETTSHMDVQALTIVVSLTLSAPTLTPSTIPTISTVPQAPTPLTTALSNLLQDLLNFGSLFGFDHRLKTLEANFSEFVQTNQFVGAVSSIPRIIQRYMDQRMNEAVKIIKEQVKEQVKVQVFKILPKIEKTVNEQLEAEVLTRSSNSSKTSYAVVVDLSEMELKKILIEKMESNKSIHRSDEQRNLYKALVEAYEFDKIILDTYGDIVTLKRRRDDDADKNKEPSAGSDRGSKRQREGKEPESTSAPKEKAIRTTGKSTQGSKSQQKTTSEFAPVEEPMQTTHDLVEPSHQEFKTYATDDQPIAEASHHPEWFQQQKKPPTLDRDWNKTLPATHGSIQLWVSKLAKQADSRSSFNDMMDIHMDFSAFLLNRLKVDTLTSKLLAVPTYELMKGSCKSLMELEFFLEEVYKETTDHQKYTTSVTMTKAADYEHIKWIEDLVPRTMWSQEPISYDKHALWGISHWGRKRQQFYRFAVNRESARDVYPKRRIIVVTELQIVEWNNYKNLDRITMRRDDDRKADKSDGRRTLCLQRLSKNVHKKHRHPKACGSNQKKLNLTKPDTYRSDLKRKDAYTAYSNLRGFIYQNKDKQNKLMWIDKLHNSVMGCQ